MTNESIDRGRLSTREDEVLELAIDGLTDVQIANALEISPSTVNSYWVRIRGKLGAKTRTELASSVLRAKARDEMSELLEQNHLYEQQARERLQLGVDAAMARIYRTALDALPEAMLITDEHGSIVYANERLNRMFRYAEGAIVGESVEILIPSEPKCDGDSINSYVRAGVPARLGVDRVVYGRTRYGQLFRIIVLFDMHPQGDGMTLSWIFRSFVNEVDDLRRNAAAFAS